MNFSKYIPNSKTHLDFGCGFGIVTYLLAQKHPKTKFYGTDIDPKMISLAKKKYRLKNLSFNQNKTKYDSISCIYVLHHINNYELALKKLLTKINHNGKILILEFRRTQKKKFLKIYQKNHAESFEEYYAIHNRWTKEQFEQTCKSIGLKTLILKDYSDYWFMYVGEK